MFTVSRQVPAAENAHTVEAKMNKKKTNYCPGHFSFSLPYVIADVHLYSSVLKLQHKRGF